MVIAQWQELRNETEAGRFWAKVERSSGCWLWCGARTTDGYGSFRFRGAPRLAHRVAYEMTTGPVPVDLCVCHHCDTPLCVRPEHLFIGTKSDNAQDMWDKGRAGGNIRRTMLEMPERRARGERQGSARLTTDAVHEVRKRAAMGDTQACLATAFGVSAATISKVVRRKSWGHV